MDPLLIEQVIINLLENAVVHSKSTLPIELTVTDDGSLVTFRVRDYGIGIPPERLDTIFNGSPYTPENQGDTYRGMGIGLSICKTIITAHSGTIGVCNNENGCTFTFTLPKERTENE